MLVRNVVDLAASVRRRRHSVLEVQGSIHCTSAKEVTGRCQKGFTHNIYKATASDAMTTKIAGQGTARPLSRLLYCNFFVRTISGLLFVKDLADCACGKHVFLCKNSGTLS